MGNGRVHRLIPRKARVVAVSRGGGELVVAKLPRADGPNVQAAMVEMAMLFAPMWDAMQVARLEVRDADGAVVGVVELECG